MCLAITYETLTCRNRLVSALKGTYVPLANKNT